MLGFAVIPAKAGIQASKEKDFHDPFCSIPGTRPASLLTNSSKVRIFHPETWMPAFAGMTAGRQESFVWKPGFRPSPE
jgi:hypothetical protein